MGKTDILMIDEFQSNMREIMRYIKYSKDKERLGRILAAESRFQNVERDAAEIINAATNSNIKIEEGEEAVNMCLGLQGLLEDSRVEGAITFARKFGISIEDVKKSLMTEYDKNEKEAEELLETYWK